jgi:hypothetical protein
MAVLEIDISDELLDNLSEQFFWADYRTRERAGPLSRDEGNYASLIVARVHGLAIKIWADEHPPPHFHVSYQGQEASFSIVDCSRLNGTNGLERYEHRIRDWWAEHQDRLIEKWNATRPTDCPVGPITPPESPKYNKKKNIPNFMELEKELQELMSEIPNSNKQV